MTRAYEEIREQADKDDVSFKELEAFVEARADQLTAEEKELVADLLHMVAMSDPEETGFGR